MRHFVRRFTQDTQAAALIEFALVFPLFMFLLFSILELGILMYQRSALEDGVQRAARIALTGQDLCPAGDTSCTRTSSISGTIQANVTPLLLLEGDLTISSEVYANLNSFGGGTSSSGSFGVTRELVQYQVDFRYDYLTPAVAFASLMGGEDIDDDGNIVISSTVFIQNEAF